MLEIEEIGVAGPGCFCRADPGASRAVGRGVTGMAGNDVRGVDGSSKVVLDFLKRIG